MNRKTSCLVWTAGGTVLANISNVLFEKRKTFDVSSFLVSLLYQNNRNTGVQFALQYKNHAQFNFLLLLNGIYLLHLILNLENFMEFPTVFKFGRKFPLVFPSKPMALRFYLKFCKRRNM